MDLLADLSIVAKAAAFVALLAAAAVDVRRRIIPDELVLVVAGTGLAIQLLDFRIINLSISLAVAAALLVGLSELSRRKLLGGGDAKLIAAVSLLIDPIKVPTLLLYIALAGGVVAVVYLAKAVIGGRLLPPATTPATQPASSPMAGSVPYGVAILLGTAALQLLEAIGR